MLNDSALNKGYCYLPKSLLSSSLLIYFLEIETKLSEHSLTEYGFQNHNNASCLCRFWIDLSLAVNYVCVISGILHMPCFKPLIIFVKYCCVDLAHSIDAELIRWLYCLLGMWLELIKWRRQQHLFCTTSLVSETLKFQICSLQIEYTMFLLCCKKSFHRVLISLFSSYF